MTNDLLKLLQVVKANSKNKWDDAQADAETYINTEPFVKWKHIGIKNTAPAWHGAGGVIGPLKTDMWQSVRGVVLHYFDPNTSHRHIVSLNDNTYAQFDEEDDALHYMKQMYGISGVSIE